MLNYNKLIVNPRAKSPIIEAYKTLRTNLQFSGLDKRLKVIMITSARASEGKSTTACNLAVTMAQNGKKVLLVDADLRKPAVHRAFGLLNEKGLTNILAEGLKFRDICNEAGIPSLEVITGGPIPPNPAELLGCPRMEGFIDAASDAYDIIILDAPPVTDAAVLSRLTDGVIFVVEHGKTPSDQAVVAKEALVKVGARIIGAVINNVPAKASGNYGYNYYYYDEDGIRKKKSERHV